MALFREKEGELLPIAIQLKQQPNEDNPVSFIASRKTCKFLMETLITYYLWSCFRFLRGKILYFRAKKKKTGKNGRFHCLTLYHMNKILYWLIYIMLTRKKIN